MCQDFGAKKTIIYKFTQNEEHTSECGDKLSSFGTDMTLDQGFWFLPN